MADESQIDPTNQKVGILLSYGIPEEDIVARLSESDDPDHQNWVRKYKARQFEQQSKQTLGLTESAVQTNEDAIKKQAELINQQGQVGISPGKLAEIGVVGKVGYELGKQIPAAAEYGSKLFGTLKDKMAVPSEVQVPAEAAPIAEAAPSGMDKLKQRLNPVSTIPAPVLSPEEVRQQRLKAAAATAQGEMANVVPGAAVPSAVAPTAATPSAVDTVTPPVDAAITADPTATPVEKAQAHVNAPETPAAVNRYDVTTPVDGVTNAPAETPAPEAKVKGAAVPKVEPSITAPLSVEQKVALLNSRIQPVPPPSEGMIKHMAKENIAGKLIPYLETRRTPTEMAIAKIETPLNKGYTQIGAASGITPQTPAPEARSFMDRVTNEIFGGKPPSSQGGGAPQVKQITNFIETNQKEFPNIYSKLKDIQARYPTQSGMAHIQMLGGIAGLGLGALGAYGAYKEGKQTGDYTNLGLLGGSLLAMSGPAQAAYQALTYMKQPGESKEELKAYGQMLQNSQQAFKVGAGRGVAPPSAYNR